MILELVKLCYIFVLCYIRSMVNDELDPMAAQYIGIVKDEVTPPPRIDGLEYASQRLGLTETQELIEAREAILAGFQQGLEPIVLRYGETPQEHGNEMNLLLATYHRLGQDRVEMLVLIPETEAEAYADRELKMHVAQQIALNILLARLYKEANRSDDFYEAIDDAITHADNLGFTDIADAIDAAARVYNEQNLGDHSD